MFTILVNDSKSGKPLYYKEVSDHFKGLDRGISKSHYTDKNGESHFNEDNGNGIVYVDGKPKFEGKIQGRILIYV